MSAAKPMGVILFGGDRTHQERYGAVFAADPRCTVLAVADEADVPPSRQEWNRALAARLGVPCLGVDEALTNLPATIASISVEPERRARLAERCADAGLHIYIDKPMACTAEEGRRIVAAAERNGITVQVFSHMSRSWIERARRAAEAPGFGPIAAIQAEMLMAKGPVGDLDGLHDRHEKEVPTSFGLPLVRRELFDMGYYPIATIHAITGSRALSVKASTDNYFFDEHYRAGTEDFASVLMRMENGATATFMAGRVGWGAYPSGAYSRVRIVGENGYVEASDADSALEVYGPGTSRHPTGANPEDPMQMWGSTTQARKPSPKGERVNIFGEDTDTTDFIDALVAAERPLVDARAGHHHLEIMEACYRSAVSGREEPVERSSERKVK